MEGAYWPIKAVWAGGSEYGEYRCVTSNRGPTEGIIRLTVDGTMLVAESVTEKHTILVSRVMPINRY